MTNMIIIQVQEAVATIQAGIMTSDLPDKGARFDEISKLGYEVMLANAKTDKEREEVKASEKRNQGERDFVLMLSESVLGQITSSRVPRGEEVTNVVTEIGTEKHQ